jgi:hypothetical protein
MVFYHYSDFLFSLSLSLSFLKKIMHNCIFTVFSAKNANKYLEFIMNLQRVWDCIIRLKKLLVVPKKFVPIKKVCLFGKKKILSLFDPFTIRVLLALPSKRACDFKTWFSKTQLNIWKNYGLTFKITIEYLKLCIFKKKKNLAFDLKMHIFYVFQIAI